MARESQQKPLFSLLFKWYPQISSTTSTGLKTLWTGPSARQLNQSEPTSSRPPFDLPAKFNEITTRLRTPWRNGPLPLILVEAYQLLFFVVFGNSTGRTLPNCICFIWTFFLMQFPFDEKINKMVSRNPKSMARQKIKKKCMPNYICYIKDYPIYSPYYYGGIYLTPNPFHALLIN